MIALSHAEALQADESEIGLVSSVLLHPEVFALTATLVEPGDFRSLRCATLWTAMAAVHATGALPDAHLVLEQLDRRAALDAVGGRQGVLEIVEACRGSGANAEHYARAIRDAAGSRRIASLASRIAERALAGEAPAELSAAWDAAMRDMRGPGDDRARTLHDLVEQAFTEIGAPAAGDYTTTGFQALDGLLVGWEPGQLVLLGARPSMGKTAFALNLAVNATSAGSPAAFFSLEMTTTEILRRLLSAASGVAFSKFRTRGWIPSDEEYEALSQAGHFLAKLPLWIDETAALTLSTLRMKLCRLVDRGVRVAFVDYLGLLVPPRSRTITSRENEVGELSRGLKRLAKEFGIAIVALQQLSRDKAKANERVGRDAARLMRPTLTDLRDSGSLEQDADVVLFLHRDAYYTKDPSDHVASVIVAKQRNGECTDVSLGWDGSTQRFLALEVPGSADPRGAP